MADPTIPQADTKRFHPAAVPLDATTRPTTLFAHSPSDALQCLIDLKTFMDRAHDHGVGRGDPIIDLVGDEASWQDWQSFISSVQPFYWSAQTAALVTAASASYPLEEEAAINIKVAYNAKLAGAHVSPPTYLPKRVRGLCVFQEPCLYVEIGGRKEALSALGWNVGISTHTGEVWLSLRGAVWTPYGAVPIWWSDGGSAESRDSTVDGTFRAERLAFTKWICTAAMFVEQEIVTTSEAVALRAIRKRCLKSQVDATCHVVMLRKELAEDHNASSGDAAEWSCRWLVRGHWRRQFYPKRGGHAPVYIHPHVKGPSDKPFAEPKPTVYSVSR